MNKKQILIEHIRIAGYNNDRQTGMRLYCNNRISRAKYDEAWRLGVRQRELYPPDEVMTNPDGEK